MKEKEITFDELEEVFKKQIEQSLKNLICPTHGQKPKVRWKNHDGASELTLDYCCSELEALAKSKMSRR